VLEAGVLCAPCPSLRRGGDTDRSQPAGNLLAEPALPFAAASAS